MKYDYEKGYKIRIYADEGFLFKNTNDLIWLSFITDLKRSLTMTKDRTELTISSKIPLEIEIGWCSLLLDSLVEPIPEIVKELDTSLEKPESILNTDNSLYKSQYMLFDPDKEAYNEMFCIYNTKNKIFFTDMNDDTIIFWPVSDISNPDFNLADRYICLYRNQLEEVNGKLKPKDEFLKQLNEKEVYTYIYNFSNKLFLSWTGKWVNDIRLAKGFIFNTKTKLLSKEDEELFNYFAEDEENTFELVSKESLESENPCSICEFLKEPAYIIKLIKNDSLCAILNSYPSSSYLSTDWNYSDDFINNLDNSAKLKFTDIECFNNANYWKNYFYYSFINDKLDILMCCINKNIPDILVNVTDRLYVIKYKNKNENYIKTIMFTRDDNQGLVPYYTYTENILDAKKCTFTEFENLKQQCPEWDRWLSEEFELIPINLIMEYNNQTIKENNTSNNLAILKWLDHALKEGITKIYLKSNSDLYSRVSSFKVVLDSMLQPQFTYILGLGDPKSIANVFSAEYIRRLVTRYPEIGETIWSKFSLEKIIDEKVIPLSNFNFSEAGDNCYFLRPKSVSDKNSYVSRFDIKIKSDLTPFIITSSGEPALVFNGYRLKNIVTIFPTLEKTLLEHYDIVPVN